MGTAPSRILELVEQFERNRDEYRKHGLNETQLRREYLDPFFEALGWDVANRQGHAPAYREVIHEDAVKIGGVEKAPDYSFRIGGIRKFFVEAKNPAVNLKDDPRPAYQLRRYAWSAKLPLSILTDFEEFVVYDCRLRPAPADKPSAGRSLYLNYRDYETRWEEIASIFAKDSILKGSFDKYAAAERKRGTATVDAEFLAEIEQWQEMLAKNLKAMNRKLSVHDLNFAVQRTIDRIIFLRICEDRGTEHYGQLQALLNGEHTYARLKQMFRQADDRYNSGLFHFQRETGRTEAPDELTLDLTVDDKILKDIIERLYAPKSPYEFSVFPAEILGQVYEQFLGKVIRLTAGHQAKVEEKPEVKKAGGVYYTPAYIVDYIVQQTVGKLCEGKTPKQIAKLRILDPACGSGSFLIGAYTYLLTYHRDWFVKDGAEQHRKELFRAASGEWRLTTQEKKRILLNNIYGVDIDSQAVEVTKLSLLLKVLEGESDETLKRQLTFVRERALPDLGRNIKCGNSLIGTDYFTRQLLPDEDAMRRINPFDWQAGFPEIMKAGGFDAVIGNPPYVRQESLKEIKDYVEHEYKSYHSMADLYVYFVEKGLALLRPGGLFSIIVSSSFLRTTYGAPLRRHIRKAGALLELVDFGGLPVFANAKDTYVCIPLLGNQPQPAKVAVCKVGSLDSLNLDEYVIANRYKIPESRFKEDGWEIENEQSATVFEKLKAGGIPLGQFVVGRIFYGIKTGLNEAFEVNEAAKGRFVKGASKLNELIRTFLGGEDIRRYFVRDSKRFLIVLPAGWTKKTMGRQQVSEREAWDWLHKNYRSLAKHLESFEEAAKRRQDKGDYWWELRPCDYYDVLEKPKIIYPDIAKNPRFFLDTSGAYIANTAYCLGSADKYLLGILNSRLAWFAISRISIPFGTRAGKFRYRLIYQYMEKLPIRPINFSNQADKAKHEQMITLVERMLDLHRRFGAATHPDDKTRLQRQIDATDREIERLVYDLYGLTEEEIAIVEGAAVASGPATCENVPHEDSNPSTARPQKAGRQAASVATAPQYAGESGGGAPEGAAGARSPIHGVRESASQYGPPPDSPEDPESGEALGSTRYFDTVEGRLSYTEVAERLAVPLVAILDDLLQTPPPQIVVTSEWLCVRHRRLAGHLFPEWAGRFRDVNVRVGAHTPPPFYEVAVFMRQFCDDLAERLHHPVEATTGGLVELLAWADWRFQWIHPFKDFNGRIGRVLLAAILYKLSLPHVETAPMDPASRQQYLDTLHAADRGDLGPLMNVWMRRLLDLL